MQTESFVNQVAIVTGSAAGIGKGIAASLVEHGASVLLVDINEEKIEENAYEFINQYQNKNVSFLGCDLKAPGVADQITQYTVEQFGRVDILVNCAGIYPSKPALEISESEWDEVLDLNLKGTFFLCQSVAKKMIEQQVEGRILNITSSASVVARPGVAHYCSSKAAVKMLTQVLAVEWASKGIRVNALAPGLVETETLQKTLITEEAIKEHEEKISYSPMARTAYLNEISDGALYLVSENSSYVTGQTLFIDGGYTAGRVFQTKKEGITK